jgi:glycosyltransferase involved in cell wall biosynthesis
MTLRVLHVVEGIEGGVARHVTDIVRHVDAEHLVVLPPERVGGFTDTTASRTMERAGARLELVDMRRSPMDPHNATATARVRGLIRRVRPHIVHGHSSIGGAVGRIAALGTGAARFYTPNGLHPAGAASVVERALGRVTDRFVAVSATEAAIARRLGIVPPQRMAMIPNGIDLDVPKGCGVDVRAQLRVDSATPIVGTITRLAVQKAPEVFVRACAQIAAKVPETGFVLVGDGPLASEFASERVAVGLEHRLLHLRGIHGAASLMSQFDVFVLASRYEGAPYAPLEAMRAGTPVVLTDVVGNRDVVEPGRSGLLVAPDDAAALATAVSRLLLDPALRRELGDAARGRIAERFDVRRMASSLTGLYREAAADAS